MESRTHITHARIRTHEKSPQNKLGIILNKDVKAYSHWAQEGSILFRLILNYKKHLT